MASLSLDEVQKIASLARLGIPSDELADYTNHLSKILEWVAEFDAVDTDDVTPMAHPLELHQRLRADKVTESDQRTLFQENAPHVEAGLYLVPKVIE